MIEKFRTLLEGLNEQIDEANDFKKSVYCKRYSYYDGLEDGLLRAKYAIQEIFEDELEDLDME